MADNNFDILIRFGLSKEKATEAVAELKKLEAQTKATGTEGVKQEAAVEEATKKTFTSKKQLKDMVKQLGAEFPLLGQIGRLAMSPIVLVTAAITSSLVIMKQKFDEAVKASGGFELPDVSEDAVQRFERLAAAAKNIRSDVSSISAGFSQMEKQRDILDAFAKGFGNPGTSNTAKAASAGLAADDSAAEAARLAGIAGNFNPNNTAAGDMAKLIPALQEHRDALMKTLNLIESVRNGSGGMVGSAKYLAKFGLSDPDAAAAQYQGAIAQTDAQIAGINAFGMNRGRRGGAFAASEAAAAQASALYEKSAGYSAAAAGDAGKDLKAASEAMASGDAQALIQNILKMANAFTEGRKATEQALRDQDAANAVARQRQ